MKKKNVILKLDIPFIRETEVYPITKELIEEIKKAPKVLTDTEEVKQELVYENGLKIKETSIIKNEHMSGEIKVEVYLQEDDNLIQTDKGYTKLSIPAIDNKELLKAVGVINGYTKGNT